MIPEPAQQSPLAILHGMARGLDRLTSFCYLVSGAALGVILISVLVEVFMRYFFNAPTTWSNDVCTWMLAISIMAALPEITRTKGNITIDVLIEKMPHHLKGKAHRAIALFSFVVCVGTFWVTGAETLRQYTTGIETMWIHPIPKWWISVCIPIGFLISGAQFLREGLLPERNNED